MKLVATLGLKGQLCLPLSVRRALGVGPGDKVNFRRLPSGGFVLEAESAVNALQPPLAADAPFTATDAAQARLSRGERAKRGLQALRGGDASEELY